MCLCGALQVLKSLQRLHASHQRVSEMWIPLFCWCQTVSFWLTADPHPTLSHHEGVRPVFPVLKPLEELHILLETHLMIQKVDQRPQKDKKEEQKCFCSLCKCPKIWALIFFYKLLTDICESGPNAWREGTREDRKTAVLLKWSSTAPTVGEGDHD